MNRATWILGAVAAAALFMSGIVTAATSKQVSDASVIFLVRHAEKARNGEDPRLDAAGQVRAKQLSNLLRDSGIQAVFSTDFARTLETAAPLASALGLRVRLYDRDRLDALAAELTATPGRRLVVGHSDTTPELVELLGGEPGAPIDEAGEYDRLYIVTVAPGGEVTTVLLRYGM